MDYLPSRRRVPHWERPGGTVCLTWRLRREQIPLTHGERDVVLAVISRSLPTQCAPLAVVVMDDHVHALIRPAAGVTGRYLASAWKSISAHEFCRSGVRQAPLWQRNYFDRWMSSEEQTYRCAEYVLTNPARRWAGCTDYAHLIRPPIDGPPRGGPPRGGPPGRP